LAGHVMTQEKLDRAMVRIAESKPRQEVLEVFDLEWHGGSCPRCGAAWVPVLARVAAVDGREFANFIYFKPNCHCFGRCKQAEVQRPNSKPRYRPGCGKLLMEEIRMGLRWCTNCGAEVGHG